MNTGDGINTYSVFIFRLFCKYYVLPVGGHTACHGVRIKAIDIRKYIIEAQISHIHDIRELEARELERRKIIKTSYNILRSCNYFGHININSKQIASQLTDTHKEIKIKRDSIQSKSKIKTVYADR
jgi:hypothetical protein